MILSDKDILKAVEQGQILITPFSRDKIYPASYTLALGHHFLRPKKKSVVIDLKHNIFPEYEEFDIGEDGYILMPEEFILGQTLEKITLSPQIAMKIEGRSSLARAGIQVEQTSSFIEPDHRDSIITMEIKNNSQNPVKLYPKMKFAKGIFYQLSSPFSGEFGGSTYTTQERVTAPISSQY
jgi:dCTP deaminase